MPTHRKLNPDKHHVLPAMLSAQVSPSARFGEAVIGSDAGVVEQAFAGDSVRSAVEALADPAPGRKLRGSSRYRPMCACCAPVEDVHPGKPTRRTVHPPHMAWRTRLAAAEVMHTAGDASAFEDEICL